VWRRGAEAKVGDVMPEQCSRCSDSSIILARHWTRATANGAPLSFFFFLFSYFFRSLSLSLSLSVYSLYSSPFFGVLFFFHSSTFAVVVIIIIIIFFY
jgi:hypothetical protein